jgi:ribonuclease P/MRP protein subunit RPP1
MKFYDLHVHSVFSEGESSLEEIASVAKKLGYTGICFTTYILRKREEDILKTEIERVKNNIGIEIFLGFEARNIRELKKLASIRRNFDILLVRGGDLKLNRAAVETPQVDILTHPEYERNDSGLNHVLAKLASKNNVAIEINFREILATNGYHRAKVLKNIRQNIILAKKYNAPIILCSGAISHYELKDPYFMISMAVQLGMSLKEAKISISKVPEEIINRSVERRDKNWIMPGVKVIE